MFRFLISALALGLLAGCTLPPEGHNPAEVFDPHEAVNRENHEFNRAIDKRLVRGAGNGYVNVVPKPVRKGVSNFSANLSLPGTIVNNILQGRIGEAGQNTLRFALNTTIGLGGLVDAAGEFKLYEVEADFGETLAVWGVREGAYVELPLLGPSTERDAVGKVVDLFTNPLSYVLPTPERHYARLADVGSGLDARGQYSDTIDSILYESADSYAQARTIYLQNRRFELGEEAPQDEIDPFEISTEGF